jgi:transposase
LRGELTTLSPKAMASASMRCIRPPNFRTKANVMSDGGSTPSCSSLSYAQARWTETLPDWVECHVQALEFFGGSPALLVPDNAKVAIIKACHFDPQVNRNYCAMAAHYGSAVLPTRPRRPRDKAKVEAAVRIVERWLLGRLRHRVFHSLAEVNAAIMELLRDPNEIRVLRRVNCTRRQLFEELDRPALRPLPAER